MKKKIIKIILIFSLCIHLSACRNSFTDEQVIGAETQGDAMPTESIAPSTPANEASTSSAQPTLIPSQPHEITFDRDEMSRILISLTENERTSRTELEYESAVFIYNRLVAYNLNAHVQELFWLIEESFEIDNITITKDKPSDNTHFDTKSQNIIASINENNSGPIIILSAHYDSIGGPGAVDNASGVCGLLEIARILSCNSSYFEDIEVRIIFFGAEEVGLKGSKGYVDTLTESEISRILGNINVDSIGYTGECSNALISDENSREFANAFLYDSQSNITPLVYGLYPSDSISFSEINIPAFTLASIPTSEETFTFPFFHSAADTLENISVENIVDICKLIVRYIFATEDMG